jgi:hypothetical protein
MRQKTALAAIRGHPNRAPDNRPLRVGIRDVDASMESHAPAQASALSCARTSETNVQRLTGGVIASAARRGDSSPPGMACAYLKAAGIRGRSVDGNGSVLQNRAPRRRCPSTPRRIRQFLGGVQRFEGARTGHQGGGVHRPRRAHAGRGRARGSYQELIARRSNACAMLGWLGGSRRCARSTRARLAPGRSHRWRKSSFGCSLVGRRLDGRGRQFQLCKLFVRLVIAHGALTSPPAMWE